MTILLSILLIVGALKVCSKMKSFDDWNYILLCLFVAKSLLVLAMDNSWNNAMYWFVD